MRARQNAKRKAHIAHSARHRALNIHQLHCHQVAVVPPNADQWRDPEQRELYYRGLRLRGRDLVQSCIQLACDEGLDDLSRLVCLRARLSNPFVNRVFEQVILATPSSSYVTLDEILLH